MVISQRTKTMSEQVVDIEFTRGVIAYKNGKGWGVEYEDGQCTSMGWVELNKAKISTSEFCTSPTSLTYPDSPYVDELKTSKLVRVVRTIKTVVVDERGEIDL